MKNKEMRVRIEADYKARTLFADLSDLADGDTKLLVLGLSVAFGIIKNDLVNLIPQPEKPAEVAAPAAPPVAPPVLDPSKMNRHTRRAIEAQTGEKVPAAPADPVVAANQDDTSAEDGAVDLPKTEEAVVQPQGGETAGL